MILNIKFSSLNKNMFNKRILKEETDYYDHPLDGVRIMNLGMYIMFLKLDNGKSI